MSSTTPPQPYMHPSDSSSRNPLLTDTTIGVDAGIRNLLTLAPASANPDVSEGRVIDDDQPELVYRTLVHVPDNAPRTKRILTDRLHRAVENVAQEAVAYTASFNAPVLVVENLSYSRRSLSECIDDNAAIECWLLPAVQRALVEAARDAGIPAVSVSEEYTTQQCHECQDFACVGRETIRCTTENCPVAEVCRDRSAAVTIARRVS